MPVVMVGLMKTLLFYKYVMTAGTCPDIVNGIFPDMLSLSGRTAAEKYSRCQWNIPRHLLKSGLSEIAATRLAILNGCLLSLARTMLKLCLTCHVGQHSQAGLVTSHHIYKPLVSNHSKLYLIKIVLVMERGIKETD